MARTAMGVRATGERLDRMHASPHWNGKHFANPIPREEPRVIATLRDFVLGRRSPHHVPKAPPATLRPHLEPTPASGLRVTWLGHSTSIVEIDGVRVLLDPMFGPRAAPFARLGPKRFHPPAIPLKEVPRVNVVAISHDHYDHLDHPTIVELAKTDWPFVVPLGVGAHLEHWGVDPARITELDWWESHTVGDVRITATPSRHFSGRLASGRDRFHTLWAGFAIHGPSHAVYFSGDTALFPGLADIGDRLGPFDIAMIECGSYSVHWRDVHSGPEQAVVASQLVGGALFLPVHWGTFDLALHGWTEPIERVWNAAAACGVPLTTPRIGETVEPGVSVPSDRWWPELPYRTAAEAPIVSTRTGGDITARVEALSRSAAA